MSLAAVDIVTDDCLAEFIGQPLREYVRGLDFILPKVLASAWVMHEEEVSGVHFHLPYLQNHYTILVKYFKRLHLSPYNTSK